jgi:hypothetical protein
MATAASIFPGTSYFTKRVALSTNALTVIYQCGEQGELAFDITGLSVSPTTANTDTCSLYDSSGGTDWCIVFLGAVGAVPLQVDGLPIHLVPGDIIKAAATAGATHALHVHLTGQKTTRTPTS